MGRHKIYKTEEERQAARKAAQARYNKRVTDTTVCVQARISPDLARELNDALKAAGITRADWLRQAIRQFVEPR